MSEAGWAERKVDGYGLLAEETAAAFILAEHKRAMRVVKAARKGVPSEPCEAWKDGYMTACDDILTALQKGRT
jgi:hypothetical protein